MKHFSAILIVVLLANSNLALGESSKDVQTMKEVSIIGNNELPTTSFDLPWQLPSVDKRADESPVKDVPGLLRPIEPFRYKQQIHFSRYLEVDTARFNAR
jgi:hypothetical protein